MPDPHERTTETEKLAGTINDTLQSMDETIRCLLQGCWWSAVGCLGFSVAFVAIATLFTLLEERIGFIATVVVFALAAWLAVHLFRRPRGDGPPT